MLSFLKSTKTKYNSCTEEVVLFKENPTGEENSTHRNSEQDNSWDPSPISE